MNKTDLIEKVAEAAGLSKKDAGKAVDAFIETVEDTVAAGERVELIGFGNFESRHRNARTGRNPQTGAPVPIAETNVPAFKPGKRFKDKVV